MYCSKCGLKNSDEANFCEGCGARMAEEKEAGTEKTYDANFYSSGSAIREVTNDFDSADISQNKVMAGLSYLLFFLPLLACPNSKFAKFHANYSLLLLVVYICIGVATGILGLIPFVRAIIAPILWLVPTAIFIFGVVTSLQGKAYELPLFEKIKIIK